jgi:inner membrane protein
MAPDLDVIGFALGIPYHHPLGHRGLFHSPFFALLSSLLITWIGFREVARFSASWWRIAGLLFIVTASHGLLDALTNGGLGIALLVPFDNGRYFFPWTPVEVSPIGLHAFLSERGLVTLYSEFVWLWLPLASLWLVMRVVFGRRRLQRI